MRRRDPVRSIYTLDGRSLAEENHSHHGRTLLYDVGHCCGRGRIRLGLVVLVTGGYDGKVKLFSYDMELSSRSTIPSTPTRRPMLFDFSTNASMATS